MQKGYLFDLDCPGYFYEEQRPLSKPTCKGIYLVYGPKFHPLLGKTSLETTLHPNLAYRKRLQHQVLPLSHYKSQQLKL